jgi:hypothetical protein
MGIDGAGFRTREPALFRRTVESRATRQGFVDLRVTPRLQRHTVRTGEDVVIVDHDGTAVRLELLPRPRFGSARGTFAMRDDFDAPLDNFAPYER